LLAEGIPLKRNSEAMKLRTKIFALRVLRLCRALPRTQEARILGGQLLRSSTSVAANYRAACRSRSRAEFVAKLGIVLEEADETAFWLELIQEAELFPQSKMRDLCVEPGEIVSIFVSSVRTAKGSPLQSDL
jgi:four helix bundle protein